MPESLDRSAAQRFRAEVATGRHIGPTAGHCMGFAQANLVVLPKNLAYDFLVFATRNPKPCPIIEVLEPGNPEPALSAPGADIRTDIPKYRVYRRGVLVEEPASITHLWQDDFVSFLIGCSFTFEKPLLDAGIPVRHIELGRNVPMFITNMQCRPAGVFHGPMVVSMRPIPGRLVAKAVEVTAAMHAVHGGPVHVGAPEAIGIADLGRPDFGDSVPVYEGEGTCVLGVRGDAAGGGTGRQAGACDHAFARAHVRHGRPRQRGAGLHHRHGRVPRWERLSGPRRHRCCAGQATGLLSSSTAK